ncbi:MAG TPA: transcriptional repressor [Oscillospiraceae bacterium]|nr:transcriptional repressor [Oscillospiraceae bacterium]HPF56866.1 transcriptional repressor [Clostridiales bacterium]HPK34905.1 transcriptional repressor [Oscillospiraceae bacterium]HPR76818.1 transcriptional repressor [Oscillospiraceae bacterium]
MNRRNTIQRDLVLDAVKTLQNHPTPEQVYSCVSARFPGISKSTVYRNLNILCDDGALLRIPVPNAAEHVDHNIDPHYHAVCRECGQIFDIRMPAMDLIANLPEGGEFEVEDLQIIFTGICANCRK